MKLPAIRQGQIYWIDDFPPLEGDRAKRRPVIVISPIDILPEDEDDILVVAVTSTPRTAEGIPLPNRAQNPGCTSGLTKPCWVIPRWYLLIGRGKLTDLAGFISGRSLQRVIEAVTSALEADADC